jgi:FKBP-type peptidyl-prolyl cis-trans isomerase FkpA
VVRVRLTIVAGVLLAGLAAGAAGCSSPVTPTPVPAFNTLDIRPGAGTEAVAGSTITVNYTGWYYDATKAGFKGLQFDSSVGRETFSFVLGAGQVIEGWDRGLVGMREGGLRRLVIPPSLGYGPFRNSVIPPNATLLFEVELLTVAVAR